MEVIADELRRFGENLAEPICVANGLLKWCVSNCRKSRNDKMNFCEQCGSISRDKSGFCAGCGAAWPLKMPDAVADPAPNRIVSMLADFPARTDPFGLPEGGPKQVWIAVFLALALGPFGLLYCTNLGTLVMLIVSVPFAIFLGKVSFLIIHPVCAIWAWRAARELSSTFD